MKIRLLAALVLSVLLARALWRYETEAPLGRPSLEVVIPAGTSTNGIADRLVAAGVIPRAWSFALLVRVRGDGARMKAGRYRFDGPYSMLDVEQKLATGDIEHRDLTFPEGRNIFDVAEIAGRGGLSAASFLVVAREPSLIADLDPRATSLEGYLFPDTYDVLDGMDERELATEMVRAARAALGDLGVGPEGREIAGVRLDLHDIVTLASIVELETAAPSERPRIASVFLNRMKKGMRLQTDPTVIYALKLAGRYDGNIRKAHLQDASPYNTYRYAGLPPGPIASAGRAAFEAVLHPEPTDALYFVSRNDGTHVFSATLRDHERAVDEFQRRRARPQAQAPVPPAK